MAAECGWIEDDSDCKARRRLYLALGLDGIGRRPGCGSARRCSATRRYDNCLRASPEGWRLQKTLGFRSVPVVADTWFYLPTYGGRTAAS